MALLTLCQQTCLSFPSETQGTGAELGMGREFGSHRLSESISNRPISSFENTAFSL